MERIQQTQSRPVKLSSNYNIIKIKGYIFKYRVDCDPPIPNNQPEIFLKLINLIRPELKMELKHFIPLNFSIYSPHTTDELLLKANLENQPYIIKIKNTGKLDISKESEAKVLMGRIIKLAQLSMNLKPIGRKYFNDKKVIPLNQFKINLWEGYSSSVKVHKSEVIMNLDLSYRLIKQKNMLDYLIDLRSIYKNNIERIKEAVRGLTVITG